MATNSPLSADPFLYKDITYDAVKDFAPVTRVGSFTLMLVVNPGLPVHSVKELIAYAKANPGKLSIASGNTAGIVGAKTLAHDASIDLLHVPYKSSPQAIEDVIAGRVSMMIVDFTVGMPHASAGQVRALAMTRLKRSALYPDLPTMDEAGIEGFGLDAWAGLVAPANTPPEVIARLNGALRKVIDNPDVQAKFKNVGFDAFSSTPEEFGAFIKAQLGIWSKMVKDANIQAE
jgi:tripartite-type tricarboxylate transporter receptor subunit TctC